MLGTEKMRAFGFKEKINAWLKCDQRLPSFSQLPSSAITSSGRSKFGHKTLIPKETNLGHIWTAMGTKL
jgi:hypothetical protein